MEVYLTAMRVFVDDSDLNKFWDLINILWQPIYCVKDLKLAIRFIKTHYPKSPIDRHFSVGGCKIPAHFSYASRWTLYIQIYAMHNQLPTLGEASISTPHGQRFFYVWDLVEFAQYLLRQHSYNDHMVHRPTWTVGMEGDHVYSETNWADRLHDTQDGHPQGARIVPLMCWSDETQLTDSSGHKKALLI